MMDNLSFVQGASERAFCYQNAAPYVAILMCAVMMRHPHQYIAALSRDTSCPSRGGRTSLKTRMVSANESLPLSAAVPSHSISAPAPARRGDSNWSPFTHV